MTPVVASQLDADGVLMVSTDGATFDYPRGSILGLLSSADETAETITSGHIKRAVFSLNTKRASSSVEIHYTVTFGVTTGPETNAPIGEAAVYIDGAKVHSSGFEIEIIASEIDEKGRGSATGHIIVPAWTGTKDVELRAVYGGGGKPLEVFGHSITVKEIA